MITLGEHVLWSYINPINDPTHYACVMIWKKGTQPKVLLQSAFPASDFMLSTKNDEIYIIERKFLETSDEFHVRILKTSIGKEPTVIWDWFKDEYRIGEGGFFMKSDTHLVFGNIQMCIVWKRGTAHKVLPVYSSYKYVEWLKTVKSF